MATRVLLEIPSPDMLKNEIEIHVAVLNMGCRNTDFHWFCL